MSESFSFQAGKRKARVVFYGRVSTDHEAQLSALENQMQWYDDQLKMHPNWTLVDRYIDRGITGTQAKKRPEFLRMIDDADKGLYDLICTREVCRFARNTVDALVYTRRLREKGIEVYFVEDNIWTLGGDGELRLSLMATLAQDESRKVSERTRAGQYISRQNGVLYGTGNILGYDREGDHYVINEEQAETVREIFRLYNDGLGCQKIRSEMIRQGRKRASGDTNWDIYAINRIIRNSTYAGIIAYGKSSKMDFLSKRENNHDMETYEYKRSDKIPPIISEEEWTLAQQNREARTVSGAKGKRPLRKKTDIWTQRVECRCGCHMRRDTWHKNKMSPDSHGYVCYGRLSKGKEFCDLRSIPEWKFEAAAKEVFKTVWTERKEAAVLAYEALLEASKEVKGNPENKKRIEKLEKRLKNATQMRMDEEITKEEFRKIKSSIEGEILRLKAEEEEEPFNINEVKEALDAYIDFDAETLPRAVIRKFVQKVKIVDEDTFIFFMSFTGGNGLDGGIRTDKETGEEFYVKTSGRRKKDLEIQIETQQPAEEGDADSARDSSIFSDRSSTVDTHAGSDQISQSGNGLIIYSFSLTINRKQMPITVKKANDLSVHVYLM